MPDNEMTRLQDYKNEAESFYIVVSFCLYGLEI